jgi:hypothetical protein
MIQSQSKEALPRNFLSPSESSSDAISNVKLSPEAAEYVSKRMAEEMLSIDRERDRLVKAMDDEILHAKQRHLYNICGRMQECAQMDDLNPAVYQELYPDVFCRFSQKGTRQRMRTKPKLRKPATDAALLGLPISRTDLLLDLNGRLPTKRDFSQTTDEIALMTTFHRQKWVVHRKDLGENLMKITYFDGSSSLLTDTDVRTLGISFAPLKGK